MTNPSPGPGSGPGSIDTKLPSPSVPISEWQSKRSRSSADSGVVPSYPLPAYLKFAPGGLSSSSPSSSKDHLYNLASYSHSVSGGGSSGSGSSSNSSTPTGRSTPRSTRRRVLSPGVLVNKAHSNDARLRRFSLLEAKDTTLPHYLPSLSCLAQAAFGSLTGVPPVAAHKWADAMVLGYLDPSFNRTGGSESIPTSEQEAFDQPNNNTDGGQLQKQPSKPLINLDSNVDTVPGVLKHLLQQATESSSSLQVNSGTRPCGYVFQRGDIAWNCRTCQTDATCVLCDSCFRNSNHEGHEVFFHRTTPGGCCDCGDAEAWKASGCCDKHRPVIDDTINTNGNTGNDSNVAKDPEEAVQMAARARQEGLDTLQTDPHTKLPPKFAAALGIVIGAAVKCLVQATTGAGIGADPVQWKLKWTDDACRIWNGASNDEHYFLDGTTDTPKMTPGRLLNRSEPQTLPQGYKLHLRLHNDDVHTFEEVIEALHEPRHRARRHTQQNNTENQNEPSLVTHREDADSMTQNVDADGQVTVKSYTNAPFALGGFRRLKSRGLHCAVVSTSQVDLELRARCLATWLTDVSAANPAAAVLVVHALVQINPGNKDFGGVHVWDEARMIPSWAGIDVPEEMKNSETQHNNDDDDDDINISFSACRRRFRAFPPHLASSYVTREEAEKLHRFGIEINESRLVELTGTDPNFYANVPYRIPSERYSKSPHALWGTLPSVYSSTIVPSEMHPLLNRLATGPNDATAIDMSMLENRLTEDVLVVDTDLRKQQEADRITSSVYPHKLPGLHLVSGFGTIPINSVDSTHPPVSSPNDWRHLLSTCSFRAPMSPVVLLLLLDPYPTKQLRASMHALFLSLLVDARFKCRFAAALGAVAYRPLSTLFCAGVGTEADSPLGFTVQIFTAGSLIRALGHASATEKLLKSDDGENEDKKRANSKDHGGSQVGIFSLPIGLTVVRCIHTNLLGATEEVKMVLNNTAVGNDDDSDNTDVIRNDNLLPALTYCPGEHPWTTLLPAATDDCFLDSRSTRHKRLPHLLRDLEYIIETPGTAIGLLLPQLSPIQPMMPFSPQEAISFSTMWARLLRLAQGMDPQKRKISGGHVEYEQNRWLEAFGLSLNFAGTRDALAESPTNSSSAACSPILVDGSHLMSIREAMGSLFAALLKELKCWLYREGMLETGLPLPPGGSHGAMDLSQVEALQRSTLHVSSSQLGIVPSGEGIAEGETGGGNPVNAVALSCATGVKMTEAQLELIESALRMEDTQYQQRVNIAGLDNATSRGGPLMGSDWLRVPHSPLAGDSLSFHLPLHRALAKSVRTLCSVVVPETFRSENARDWWKLPVLDEDCASNSNDRTSMREHPLVALIRPTLRSSNCRVIWSAGPDCSPAEAQMRRARSKNVSAAIGAGKIIHTIADHPIRCIAAAEQIERHLWARNGGSTNAMALNYSSAPLCRSFRDLDLTLVQLSASGLSMGLGARSVFALLTSRFSLDGYLCDPERRVQGSTSASSPPSYVASTWMNPPRLQDPEHAVALSESFFSTLCVLVTELPPPPPLSSSDDNALKSSIRRELLHALAAEPRSHSEAMEAASSAVSSRDESSSSAGSSGGAGVFRETFAEVLRDIGAQKKQGSSRASSGPPAFELRAAYCHEYDPTFFHLRRQEHQHAMDNVARLRNDVARLRRQKTESSNDVEAKCLPIVCGPPKAHPRFLPSRLLLHLQPMDAALRRALLFALTGGSWLPPSEPAEKFVDHEEEEDRGGTNVTTTSHAATGNIMGSSPSIPVTTFGRRAFKNNSSTLRKNSLNENTEAPPFSPAVVAASSVSFLEVLQLLTLQVHTLEECASLHRVQPDLDEEAKLLSASLSINSYLGRLVRVPESLVDVWALRKSPHGPLPSKGSGEHRGSIIGLLVALYEHRADHGSKSSSGHGSKSTDDGHGGARTLTVSGLKWLLRFVNTLVDGAPSVSVACQTATDGVRFRSAGASSLTTLSSEGASWTIDESIRSSINGMLRKLPDLWPEEDKLFAAKVADDAKVKSKEARKAAQLRVMEMMKKKQNAFALTVDTADTGIKSTSSTKVDKDTEDEADLCIICRCDDTDGEANGPLGYLGHVQRSRAAQMRATKEGSSYSFASRERNKLFQTYRVVGDRGCQLRSTEAMDSAPLACLSVGSIVTVLKSKVSDQYDLLSRRILVRHVDIERSEREENVTEGWASIQSSQGYVILSPLSTLCFTNGRWGNTRPIIRQCGHAAHLQCVEAHTLSLHSRAAGDQPYDGRFAANIDDGEFLCPLCKQLSNILIPRDLCARDDSQPIPQVSTTKGDETDADMSSQIVQTSGLHRSPDNTSYSLRKTLTAGSNFSRLRKADPNSIGHKALRQFGAHLLQAMVVPWERTSPAQKRKQKRWHPAIRRWDFEDESNELLSPRESPRVKDVLRLLRQQHIAWAAIGHGAASAEASSRGVEEVLPFGVFSKTSDPWPEYRSAVRDDHPMLLEMKRILGAASGLLEVLIMEMRNQLESDAALSETNAIPVIGSCLADILEGQSWLLGIASSGANNEHPKELVRHWNILTALISSIPCHTARDGMLSQRHEARAAAAAMWAVKGLGTATANPATEEGSETASNDPPVPLAIKQLHSSAPSTESPQLPTKWGTMDPFIASEEPGIVSPVIPFRPGVASAFLYMPLLAWDMNTFAGAIFSTMLASESNDQPRNEDLLLASQTLLLGRMVQAIVTPCGYDLSDSVDEEDDEEHWNEEDLNNEGLALAAIVAKCEAILKSRSLDNNIPLPVIDEQADRTRSVQLFKSVGQAILPFARSLILLLRASTSTTRQRGRKQVQSLDDKEKLSAGDKLLESLLDDSEVMTNEDGFYILQLMGGPLPSQLLGKSGTESDIHPWWSLINKWLVGVIGLELNHGSRGKNIASKMKIASKMTPTLHSTTEKEPSHGQIAGRLVSDSDRQTSNNNYAQAHSLADTDLGTAPVTASDLIAPNESNQENLMDSEENDEESEDSGNSDIDEDEFEEDEDMEDAEDEHRAMNLPFLNGRDLESMLAGGIEVGSDEELDEMEIDVEDEAAGFFEQALANASFGLRSHAGATSIVEDSSEKSSVASNDGGEGNALDRGYAYVSCAPILPYQPSLLGLEDIGSGPRGASFEYTFASSVMCDLSYLGMIHRKDSPVSCLIRLPISFVELYNLVNRVKGQSGTGGADDTDDSGSSETAVCLLTGSVMRAGSIRRAYSRVDRPPGACTLHARKVGSGIGVFFLVQKCTVLLMHNNKSAYSPSLFVDEHGEEDPGLRRGRPLLLNDARYRALEKLWRQQGIPREVAQIRSTSDRVIRDNWY